MIGNGDCHCTEVGSPLHDDMASSSTDFLKTRMRQTSRPERTRSLPMSRFEAGDKYLSVEPAFDFGRIGTFEKEFDGFFEVRSG